MKRLATKALSASALDDILVPFLAGMIHVTIVVLGRLAARHEPCPSGSNARISLGQASFVKGPPRIP